MSSTVCVGTGQLCFRRQGTTAPVRSSLSTPPLRESISRSSNRFSLRHTFDTRLNVSTLEPPPATEHVMWFDKFPEHWTTAHSEEELQSILLNERGRMIFIDFYAGFCGACRAAFPQLSRVAGNPDFQRDFLFVKCCVTDDGIRDFLRKNGITGIPTAMVCAPGGEQLISFGASFRKINAVKANLVVMAANPGAEFMIDPNGYVMPRPGTNE